jgi:hypothetical protein
MPFAMKMPTRIPTLLKSGYGLHLQVNKKSRDTLFQIHHEIAGRAPGQKNVTTLLGEIGEDGWELVEYSEGSRKLDGTMRNLLRIRSNFVNCQTETWIFKRPKD